MRRVAELGALAAGLAAVPLVTVLLVFPDRRDAALDAYVLVVGAALLAALAHAARDPSRDPSELEQALAGRRARPEPIAELERIERAVVLGSASVFDLHYRLRPLLATVARHRLATRRGIDLDEQPAEARAALGPAWDVARPDRPPPGDRFAPGIPPAQLDAVVDALERL